MASNINYAGINENFPVAGQDNDTQVFRDNFDTIKSSLASAKSEITDLQDNTAKLNVDNDFDGSRIANAIFQDVKNLKFDGGQLSAQAPATEISAEINYNNGGYQVYRFGSNASVTLSGFPTTNQGKMTLEIYGDGGLPVNDGSLVIGETYTITFAGNSDFTTIGASSNAVGTTFVATGTTTTNSVTPPRTGTVALNRVVRFISVGGIALKKNSDFPKLHAGAAIPVLSSGNPVIVEIWQHDSNKIFLNYLGVFN